MKARVISQRALPGVRAASGLARHRGRLIVVQDDASSLAVIGDTIGDTIETIALPWREETKREKYDLEACCVIGDALYAFGSGSTPRRETIVRYDGDVATIDAAPLYAQLRAAIGHLNIEGATVVGEELWLFHRGNCAAGDRPAVARCDLAMTTLLGVEHHDLGSIGEVSLGFTDATTFEGRVYYLAAAEASPDAIADGEIIGTVIGELGGLRMTLEVEGRPVKAEGLALLSRERALVVEDPDDPKKPARMFEVAIEL